MYAATKGAVSTFVMGAAKELASKVSVSMRYVQE